MADTISSDELDELNPKKKLVDKSKRNFGTTFDCREAGFILEDGDMLDFSGKKVGGTAKTRNLDHREICEAIETGSKGISGDKCLDFFERKANAIRFGTYGSWDRGHDMIVQLNTFQIPTDKQKKRISRCCSLFKVKEIAYDVFDDRGDRVDSGFFKGKCDVMVDGIASALNKAKKSKG